MLRFQQVRSVQTLAAVHASVRSHFNLKRHLYRRENFKTNRDTAMAEWRQLAA